MIKFLGPRDQRRRQGLCAVVAAALLVCVLGLGSAISVLEASTLLFFKSEPGESIGGGQTRTLTDTDFTFGLFSQGPATGVSFFIDNFGQGGHEFWSLALAPPAGGQLTPGVYERARRFGLQTSNHPGFDLSGDGLGLNMLFGRFVVSEAVYSSSGQLLRLAADFEQHDFSGSPGVLGSIRFNSDIPVDPSPTVLLRSDARLHFLSQPGDFIGLGQERTFTDDLFDFHVQQSAGADANVFLSNFLSGGNEFWGLSLAAPTGESLDPKVYDDAARFASAVQAGLDFGGDGRGCNQSTGRFTVGDFQRDDDGLVTHLVANFEQHCEGAAPALFGEISYGLQLVPAVVPAPSTIFLMIAALLGLGLWHGRNHRRNP